MTEHMDRTGLAFFGTVTASISHEIKNRIAIINEQAGLLEDFVLMAERGTPIDMDRLKRLSRSVRDQVRRADEIIRNMNRFAHSVDTPRVTVGVKGLLDLTVRLAARAASLKGVRLEVDAACPEMEITTDPFSLVHLVWIGIESVLGVSTQGDVLSLACEREPHSVIIQIGRGPSQKVDKAETVLSGGGRVAEALGADIRSDPETGAWILRLPKDAPASFSEDAVGGDQTNSRKEV
ncbi:MAG: hypothetical protein PVG78_16080 [Desulfobacterales bacterium]